MQQSTAVLARDGTGQHFHDPIRPVIVINFMYHKDTNSLSNYFVIMIVQNMKKILIFFAFLRHEVLSCANNNAKQ